MNQDEFERYTVEVADQFQQLKEAQVKFMSAVVYQIAVLYYRQFMAGTGVGPNDDDFLAWHETALVYTKESLRGYKATYGETEWEAMWVSLEGALRAGPEAGRELAEKFRASL